MKSLTPFLNSLSGVRAELTYSREEAARNYWYADLENSLYIANNKVDTPTAQLVEKDSALSGLHDERRALIPSGESY